MLISNSVNLTDGMDGLAIMPANFAVLVYGILAYVMGNVVYAEYLRYDYLHGAGELMVFCAALFGAGLGFLWYNAYPAQIIMGDTGSMALGGILASIAIMLKQEVLFIIVGGVFVAETLSSFIQQKIGENILGRRIFYRAPLHHQMEYRGLAETKVVIRLWIIAGLLAMIGLASMKLR
jgi:phospho-N-acetylmuramoyl-pentapeptide-transferase